ncbi:hypothetical protein Dimus_014108 [Dionaea muscipula]
MRGSIGRLRAPSSIGTLIGSPTAVKQTHLASFSSFSTFSGNPPGCGRGRSGSSTIPFQADPERASDDYGWWFGPDDDAKAEKFEQKVWPEIRSKFTEVLDEVERKMFPCKKEIYLDSLDINLKIEFDPEYYLDFENDPDRDDDNDGDDASEQMKPFLMSYEGIQNQQEWEIKSSDNLFIFLPMLIIEIFWILARRKGKAKENENAPPMV